MRIPSALTENNLYRQPRHLSRGLPPHRHLLRLGLAMVLIVLVMRQAGDAKFYEVFFPQTPPDVARATSVSTPLAAETRAAVPAESGMGGLAVPGAERLAEGEQVERWPEIFATLSQDDARRMFRWLTDPATDVGWGGTPRPEPSEPERYESDRRWLTELIADPSDPPTARAILRELDRWAIRQVDPAAVWKGSDALAFYRLLDPAAIAQHRDLATVRASVISLVQQPEVYLNRRLLIPAKVARAIRRSAKENPFRVTEYWELWLRPDDGSERPLVLFTAEVPAVVSAVGGDQIQVEGPAIWAEGIYLKQLAYRSALGTELAPALIGVVHAASNEVSDEGVPPGGTEISGREVGWVLIGATVFGVGLGGTLYWLAWQGARRATALRRATLGRKNPFLDSLAAGERESDSHREGGNLASPEAGVAASGSGQPETNA